MRRARVFVALLILAGLASQAARVLRVDNPQKSDAIVVLAGETALRPQRGLELLRQEMAPQMWIDVVSRDQIFGHSLVGIAEQYAAGLPESSHIKVCALEGLSTNAEAIDVRRCLQPYGIHRVLIVTSEYHSRRALTVFQHRLPEYQISVAAATDPTRFGVAWWTRREWAKTTFDEWSKLIWWEAVDRWRTSQ